MLPIVPSTVILPKAAQLRATVYNVFDIFLQVSLCASISIICIHGSINFSRQ
jgi:hypothetical protein